MFSPFRKSWLNQLSRSLFGRSRPIRLVESRRNRPNVELLEDRITPTTFTVTDPSGVSGSGSAGDVTLPYAIANAVSGDTINFNLASGTTITLNATLSISQNITIMGPGAANLAVSGGYGQTVVSVAGGATATISGLTIENGQAQFGGGISNQGTLTLSNDAVSNNGTPGNTTITYGAGIYNTGTLVVNDTTIDNNTAWTVGGGIYNTGSATLSNDTIFGNAGYTSGGGIDNFGTMNLTSCTVADNVGYGGYTNPGGITNHGTLTLDNTIVNGNTGGDVNGTYSGSYNLVGAVTGLSSSLAYNNGAPTQTLALSFGSNAIGTGDPAQAGTISQNGLTRPTAPDIGAYQSDFTPVVTMNTANLQSNVTAMVINGMYFSSNPANDSVTFDNGVTGTVTAATASSLTVSLTGLSSVAPGTPLDASVTTLAGSSGALVQVATVVAPSPYAYAESLDGSGNLTISQENVGDNDHLSFSLAGGVYTLTDTGGLLFDNPTGAGSGFITGGTTSTITIPSADVTSITVSLNGLGSSGTNIFTGTGTDTAAAPLSVNTGTATGDHANITGDTLNSGAISLTSNAIAIDANISTAGGQTYTGPVTLGGDATLADTASGNIAFNSTVDGGHNLAVNAGGVITFSGAVGAITPLASLTLGGTGTVSLGGNITTSGAQTYNDPVTLGADTVTSGSNITFSLPVDGVASLTVNATGNTTFADVGDTLRLDSLTVNTATMTTGNINSGGNVTVNDSGAASITGTVASGNLSSDLIDGDFTTPAQGTGYTYDPSGSAWTFTGGAILQGNGSAWGFPNSPGGSQSAVLQINPAQPVYSGAISQTFDWPAGIDTISFYLCQRPGEGILPVDVQVDGVTIDTVSVPGTSWTLYTTTFTTTGGSHTLTFSATTPGSASDSDTGLWGVSVVSLGSGTLVKQGAGALSLTGSSTIAATVAAGALGGSGTIGPVTDNATINPSLGGAPSVLNTGNLSFGAGGVYSVALDGDTTGTYDQLSVTGSINLTGAMLTGTLGYTPAIGDTYTIIQNVNNTPIIGGFTNVTDGLVTIGGLTFAVNYFGGAGNDVVLTRANTAPAYGESLDGSGNLIVYQEIANANDNLTFSLSGGVYTLTDTGGLVFDNPGGAGAGFISGGGTSSITIPSSDVTSITVTLGSGTNDFTIGATDAAVAPLSVNTGAATADTLNMPDALLDSGAVTLTAATIDLNGGNVETSGGGQNYAGAVTLGAATTLTDTAGGNITLGSSVNGAFTLAVNTAGVTTFGGVVGGNTALTSITTDAPGSTTITGAAITTSGAQTYNDPVTIGANTVTSGSNVTFPSTVDGPGGLTVNATGAATFSDDVGAATQLGSLTVNTATMTAGNISAGSVTVNDSGAASITGTINGGVGVSSLVDGDFTTPAQSSYTYNPTGSAWTFTGHSILQHNGSAWGYANTPAGSQSAGLQNQYSGDNAAISQTFNWLPGTDTISFYLAQRPGYGTLPVDVQVDGVTIDTVSNSSTSWTLFTTTFTSSGGSHTLTFSATTDPSGGDSDSGLWGVSVTGTGPGTLVKQGAGALSLTGTSAAVTTVAGGILGGSGTIGPVTDNATINPSLGGAPSVLNTGNLSFGAGGVYSVALDGDTTGTYDQLSVTGSINLTGAMLTGTLGYTPAIGDTYTIIQNVNNTPIIGGFTNVTDGLVTIGGLTFAVNYFGGAGNDVVLTRANTAPTYGETLDGSGNLTISQNVANANDNLTFSLSGGVYTFTDTGGLLFANPTGAGASFISGGGTDSITIPSSEVTSITVALGTGTNVFTIGATDAAVAPLSVNTGATPGDLVNILDALLDSGSLALTASAIDLGGGSVSSAGSETYTGAVTLSAATTLADSASGNITFGSTVNGAFALTVNTAGVTAFNGVVGGTTPLASLTTDAAGSTAIGAATQFSTETTATQMLYSPLFGANPVTIQATGSQTFTFNTGTGVGMVTSNLSGSDFPDPFSAGTFWSYNLYNTSTAGTITPNGPGSYTVDFPVTFALTLTSGPLAGLSFYTEQAATFTTVTSLPFPPGTTFADPNRTDLPTSPDAVAIYAGSTVPGYFNAGDQVGVSFDRTVVINAVTEPAITTSGDQTYNDPVSIGANTVMTGSNVTFASTVDGTYNLTVNATGNTTFGGDVGGISPLTSLTVNTATMTAGNITTFSGVTVNDSAAASITGAIAGGLVQSGLLDGDFTAPSQGTGYTYDPTGSAWTFTGGAILQGNGSAWGYATTPSGPQSAGLQYNPGQSVPTGGTAATGTISQTFDWPAGVDTISFYLAQRPGYGTVTVQVQVDGVTIDTVSNSSTSWTLFTTTFATTGGQHTLSFFTDGGTSTDSDSGLWGVSVTTPSPGPLVKQGAGTLTLTSSSVSSVAATISGGVLEVDGTIGAVTIPSGSSGLLSGTGTVGAITDNDATNPGSPASSVGTLNASSADFSGGGNLTINVTSPTSADLLNVSGGVNLGGTSVLTVDLNGLTAPTGGPITVVSAGSVTGTFATVNVINNPDGFTVDVNYTGNTVTITVVSSGVSTTTSLTSNPVGPITQGTSVDFTATISGSPSVGTVSFYYDYGQTDQIIISSNVAVSGGTATSSSTTALPAGNDLITAIYSGGAGFAGSTGTLLISVTSGSAPPTITSVVINEDISALYNAAGQPAPGTQRSMVNDIVYTFNEAVNIVSPSMEANVFTIAIAAGWTGTLPTLSWAPVAGSGNTEWAVSFSGASVTGGSIANGAYTITVNDPSAITAVSNSEALSLASSGIGSATQSFYRLYGDINGDEFVNASDNLKFKQALTTYNAAFDFNDDGFVNASDNLKFKANLTVNFSGFTPTI